MPAKDESGQRKGEHTHVLYLLHGQEIISAWLKTLRSGTHAMYWKRPDIETAPSDISEKHMIRKCSTEIW